ncbi:DUF707 domain-containing protein [Oceanicella sp. SM1341]|uniref:DUF707 domain-containing protein n=1 Tax=Oceanicella sp. SM1341 TaxID=1548889 RepID=UPI001300887B|nr:DUF707 domain-containing protein [Oceanicella sp. SM1341]
MSAGSTAPGRARGTAAERAAPAPGLARRNLVFARVGRNSLYRHWLGEPAAERNWDLQLSTYDPDAPGLEEGDFPLSVDRGTKWDSICRHFRERPWLLDRYEFVMFPDDDLFFDQGNITRLFALCSEEGLDIAQPALLPSSYVSYPIVMQCPRFRLRYTNYVEPMTPVIRASYFKVLLPYLERWPTGWGQDDIWTLLMPEPAFRAAVIDAVPVLHTRPLYTGDIYRHFEKLGMDPRHDLSEIRASFRGLPGAKRVYGGVLASGTKVGSLLTNTLNGLHLLRAASSVRARYGTQKTALGMLLRSVTRFRYRPSQLQSSPAGGIGAG